jgi:hypothetical protein
VLTELAQSLAADRAVLRELLASGGRGEGPRGAGSVAIIPVPKFGEADDAEAFLETFQGVAKVSGWPRQEWDSPSPAAPDGGGPACGPQSAGRGPAGLYPEEHRPRFRTLAFTEGDRLFAFAQQLRDQARRWLVPDQNSAEDVVDQVALERFDEGLPARASAWVRYHQRESLSAAVDLAESHLQPPPMAQHRSHAPVQLPYGGIGQVRRRGREGGSPFRSGHMNHLQPLLCRRALRRQGRDVGGAGGLVTSGGIAL